MARKVAMFAMAFVLALAPALAETRLVSVYIESLSVLQSQFNQAAHLFEAEQLGAVPMMMTMQIPGVAQIDRDAPIGLHVYRGTGQQFSVVIEVKPTGAIGDFLGVLLAPQGAAVPEPVDGRYVTAQGAAQAHGDVVLIARRAQDLDLALQSGIPSDLPDVPGALRMDLKPARLVKVLADRGAMVAGAMAGDAGQQEMVKQLLEMYQIGLAQIGEFHYGIGVSAQGLELRSRMVPQPGQALDRIVQSLEGVDPSWLSRLEGGHVIGMVFGAYTVPDDVQQRLLDRYIDWMQTFPSEVSMEPAVIREMLEPSLATLGAPGFLFGGMGANGKLDLYGGMRFDDAASWLAKMIALSASEDYQELMRASGMKAPVLEERIVNDHTVYRWNIAIDEDAMIKHMQQSGAPDAGAEELAQFKKIMDIFLAGYDYAATEQGLVFGITDDAGIIKAMQLLSGTEGGPGTILERIGASVTPYMVGRIDLPGLLGVAREMGATFLPALQIKGEGVFFAGWRDGNTLEHVMRLPAADVRAIKHAATARQR